MHTPEWLKKGFKDPGTKKLTAFLLLGFPLFSVAQKYVNGYDWLSWDTWQTAVCGYGFFLVVFIPLVYFNRNTK